MPPAPERVSLADVARMAGVSMATASRAMSNAYGVSAATRQRVLDVAHRTQYVPSPEASRLAGGSTQRVALVVPHLDRWYFGAMVGGLEAELAEAGLDVLLYVVDGPADRQRFFAKLPARRKVDAVVVVAFPVAEREQQRLDLMGVTIVAAGGQDAPYAYVSIDDEAAGRQAMNHLLQLRHQRVGMIEAVDPDLAAGHNTSKRSQAYYNVLAEAGLPIDERLVVTVDWGGPQGADAMARLLSLREPPTAIYAHSDEVALGAMRTLRRAGLRVPDDLSVIGIDDHPLAELTDLTTVHQPVREQAGAAAQMLLALLRGENVDRAVTVATHLVVRGSTAPPRP